MTVADLIVRLKELPDQNAIVAIQNDQGEPVLVTEVEGYPTDHHFPYAFITGERL